MKIRTNGDIEVSRDDVDGLGDCWDGMCVHIQFAQDILYGAARTGVMTKEDRARLQNALETIREDSAHGYGVERFFLPTRADYEATIRAYDERMCKALGLEPVKEFD